MGMEDAVAHRRRAAGEASRTRRVPQPDARHGRLPEGVRSSQRAVHRRRATGAVSVLVQRREHLGRSRRRAVTGPRDHLASLDVFRGVAVAGMILVNNPGNWGSTFEPLTHANGNGCTFADLVFPSFVFIVGAAMPFAFA